MFAPEPFAVTDAREAAAIVAAHPFAVVCVNGPDGPVAAHVPLVARLAADGTVTHLIGHLARANPLWAAAGEAGAPALAIFRGPDAYVSPSAYPSKAAHGRAVPTWNYVAAEARGRLTVEPDPARLHAHLAEPTDRMEAARVAPWSIADAPAPYVEALTRGVVGLEIAVTSLTAKKKLSQNKDDADHAGVVADLQARPDPAAHALARLMQQERMS